MTKWTINGEEYHHGEEVEYCYYGEWYKGKVVDAEELPISKPMAIIKTETGGGVVIHCRDNIRKVHKFEPWAKWVAKDEDGEVYQYEKKPMLEPKGGLWANVCVNSKKINLTLDRDWKDSLHQIIDGKLVKWEKPTSNQELTVHPKFKVGDRIIDNDVYESKWEIIDVDERYYYLKGYGTKEKMLISDQDGWDLIPQEKQLKTVAELLKEGIQWVEAKGMMFKIERIDIPNNSISFMDRFVRIENWDEDTYKLLDYKGEEVSIWKGEE